MNARIDFSELTNGASEITGVYVANTYFPTSIDVGNGDSVTIEMTWNADGTMTAAVPVVERAWKFGDILAFKGTRTSAARFMVVRPYNPSQVTVLVLDDDFDLPGTIQNYNNLAFERVEEA